MPYYNRKRIGERLNFSTEFVDIVENDPVISERMRVFNYNSERLLEVRQMINTAASRDRDQRVKLGQQTAATSVLKELVRGMRLTFSSDRKIARTLLRGNETLYNELRLGVKMDGSKEVFLQQARHFYEQAFVHEEVTTLFDTHFNITPELFVSRMKDLDVVEEAMRLQQVRVGETRTATRLRNEAMKELDSWMNVVIGVARQVFREEEDLLLRLGVEVIRKPRGVSRVEASRDTEV